MTAQQLKNSILQMAVQGKLVPQDPNDEPASVLLERIRAEKEAMVKAGKIKKEKNPSVIFRGADNLPYEKIGNREPVCIADEVPFEIPESWEWVRLGNLFWHNTGKALNSSNRSGQLLQYITTSNLYWNRFELDNVKKMYFNESEVEKCTATKGDLLVCEGGDIGRAAIWNFDYNICIQNHIHRLRTYVPLCTEYYYYLFYLYKHVGWIGGKGIGIQGLSYNAIHALLFPLPPIDEQIRIVEKIKLIKPLTDNYTQASEKLDDLNVGFPEQLKKSILQLAVQGKLVPQDPNDEPASVLLERIRAEKEQLIKAGKIKRDKHESVIYRRDNSHYEKVDGIERCIDDEIPFEIPDNWEWARLGKIVFNHGQRKPESNFCYIDIGSIDNKKQQLNADETILSATDAPSRARKIVEYNDIIYSTVRPYLHNMCIINKKFSLTPIASTGFAVLACHAELFNKFLFYYMMAPDFDSYANNTDNAKGVAYPAINDDRLYRALIPVPPVAEQYRIVDKIDELLSITQGL